MKYEVIDQFLPKDIFGKIKSNMIHPDFTWNLCNSVSNSDESFLLKNSSYYFVHIFFNKIFVDENIKFLLPLLDRIDCKSLIRIKGNLYPSTEKVYEHNNHVDYNYSHKGAIFYLNTNNGKTILNNTIEINSVENRLLYFDPSIIHKSTTCSDKKYRLNININYF